MQDIPDIWSGKEETGKKSNLSPAFVTVKYSSHKTCVSQEELAPPKGLSFISHDFCCIHRKPQDGTTC